MNDEIKHDRQTKELFARSRQLTNQSQMLLEFCEIQSKKIEALCELSDEVIKACERTESENLNLGESPSEVTDSLS